MGDSRPEGVESPNPERIRKTTSQRHITHAPILVSCDGVTCDGLSCGIQRSISSAHMRRRLAGAITSRGHSAW